MTARARPAPRKAALRGCGCCLRSPRRRSIASRSAASPARAPPRPGWSKADRWARSGPRRDRTPPPPTPFSTIPTRLVSRPRMIGRLDAPGAKLEPVMPGLSNRMSPRVAPPRRRSSSLGTTVTVANCSVTIGRVPAGGASATSGDAGASSARPAGSAGPGVLGRGGRRRTMGLAPVGRRLVGGLRVDVALPDDLWPAHGLGRSGRPDPARGVRAGMGQLQRPFAERAPNRLTTSCRDIGRIETSNRSIPGMALRSSGLRPASYGRQVMGRRKQLHCVIVIRPGP
jgi:hypothetical protein